MLLTLMILLVPGNANAAGVQVAGRASPATMSRATVDCLRCEYLTDPLGLDCRTPRLSWVLRDDRRGAAQQAYQILVADDAAKLAADEGNLWDTGRVASGETAQIEYAGRPLAARMQVWWKVRVWDRDNLPTTWSFPARWTMGLLQPSDWQARWIGDPTPPPDGYEPLPATLLRKAFAAAAEPPRRATVYVTALGLYELHLNGQRVGDRVLTPEWTDYHRRVQYQTYDVTKLLRDGDNVLGVMLADGWYAGKIGLTSIVPGGPPRAIYGRRLRLLLQLEVENADGQVQRIVTDDTWRTTNEGPVRVGDLLDGEVYDARRELPGWDAPGFDAAAWTAARIFEPPTSAPAGGGKLQIVAQPNEPIRIVQDVKPAGMIEPKPGVYIFDLGQNIPGWCRLKVRGPAGTTITLRHAEVLNPDGTLYTANLRGAAQTDKYTLRGDGDEVFEPRFTYHGFRYVEVTGLPEKPALDALVGRAFCSAPPRVGYFECSDGQLNRLMENILWTQRANMMSVPTDCPQRDERMGWMGDITAFGQTACYTMDMAAFYTKWLADVRDAQTADGRYPDFAPQPFDPNVRFSGVPAWGDAGVVVPWRQYVNYGDRRLIAEHFESMRRWVDWIHANNPNLLWQQKRGNDYGDWLNADTLKLEGWPAKGAEMPKEVFATAFFAQSADLLARMALVIDKTDEAQRYRQLANDIRAAFQKAYVEADGKMTGDTQAGYAIALAFNLMPDELRPAAVQRMIGCFEKYHGLISTGFLSTICLMNELSRAGRADEAYRLLNNRAMPSWRYPIEHGATTIWERWDGFVEGRGFQDPGMNSFNHWAFGSVAEWMFRTIGGIQPDEQQPGYRHFLIRPVPGGGLTWAEARYDSLRGPIRTRWEVTAERFTLELTVPANTSATVYLPTTKLDSVTDGGSPIAQQTDIESLGVQDGAAAFRVQAGMYRLECAR